LVKQDEFRLLKNMQLKPSLTDVLEKAGVLEKVIVSEWATTQVTITSLSVQPGMSSSTFCLALRTCLLP